MARYQTPTMNTYSIVHEGLCFGGYSHCVMLGGSL